MILTIGKKTLEIKQFENIFTDKKISYSEAKKDPTNTQIRFKNNKIMAYTEALSLGKIK